MKPAAAPPRLRPLIGIDGEATHPPRLGVIERAMMGDLSVRKSCAGSASALAASV
ncbi:MAG TPA: hypothetical protein VHZ55_09665 [Bryobacteraceae bacterium]|nr:hypothetical protein [Bryobacteraceae bacterium]